MTRDVTRTRSTAWRNLPPISIDTPDRHDEEFYTPHDTAPGAPLGTVSIAMLCITTAIAAAAAGAFVTMLYYT